MPLGALALLLPLGLLWWARLQADRPPSFAYYLGHIGIALVCFSLLGFPTLFDTPLSALTGITDLLFQAHTWTAQLFLSHLLLCLTVVTIVSASLHAGVPFHASASVSALTASLIYPFVAQWIWGGIQHGQATGWLVERGFLDWGGATAVYIVGGYVELATCWTYRAEPHRPPFSRRRPPIQDVMAGLLIGLGILSMYAWQASSAEQPSGASFWLDTRNSAGEKFF